MSETGVAGKSGRRSRAEANRLAAEFEQSGMTRAAFCQMHGLSAHRLDYYRRMRRVRSGATPQLLPVELVRVSSPVQEPTAFQAAPLRVELSNGRRIVVEEGFSAKLLQALVAALES